MALSLTPALCATLLKPVDAGHRLEQARLLRLVQPDLRPHRAAATRAACRGCCAAAARDADHLRGDRRRAGAADGAAADLVPAERGPGHADRQRPAAAGRDDRAHQRGDGAGRGLHARAARGRQHGQRDGLQLLGQRPERGARPS
ncbi:MAG: hypothetical protein MZW92_50445 [Comamonadaceae bacterium]|nr:hypothetical protein [Comamonadaceae bacterium]